MESQIIVLWNDENRKQLEGYLKSKGYTNPHEGMPEPGNAVNAYCVDKKSRKYYGVSASICAAWSMGGRRKYKADEIASLV